MITTLAKYDKMDGQKKRSILENNRLNTKQGLANTSARRRKQT
jgi:hypothetical protein